MSSDDNDSDKTEPFDEQERYLEQSEFMEHPDFGQDDSKSLHRNVTAVRAIRQRKLMSAAIRQRVREQSEAHLYITPTVGFQPHQTSRGIHTGQKSRRIQKSM